MSRTKRPTILSTFSTSLPIVIATIFCVILIFSACKKVENDSVPPSLTYTDFNKLGFGYDPTQRYMNVSSTRAQVIDMKKLNDKASERIIIDLIEDETSQSYAGGSYSEYIQSISAHSKLSLFGDIFKGSFDYMDSSTMQSDEIVASYHNYIRKKQLKINASNDFLKSTLTASFQEDVRSQSPQWLVAHYGTCVLLNITLGGRLEVVYRSQTTNSDRKSSAMAGLSSSVNKIFDININGNINSSLVTKNTNQHLFYHTIGGNTSYGLIGDIALTDSISSKLQITQWHNSITLDNAQLIDIEKNDGVVMLSDLIDDKAKSVQVAEYIKEYLIANQIVIGDPPNPIYTYYDGNNNKHAYSVSNLPSIKGSFNNVGSSFKGYDQAKNGAIQIYEQYNAAKIVWVYTQSSTPLPGFTVNGPAFYAFSTQVAGTVPVYEFYFERVHNQQMSYDYYYKTDQTILNQDHHFIQIAFYAYP